MAEDALDELYAVPPEHFTVRRDELARAARTAGERARAAEIAALRRPAVSAWLVNALVRKRRQIVEGLLELGAALRDAESELAGDALRELSARRNEVVAALVHQAVELGRSAGVRVSSAAEQEVQATLQAALARPAVAEAVRAGRLVQPASYAGFGSWDDDALAAGTFGGPAPSPSDHRREGNRRAEEARRRAEGERAVQQAASRLAQAEGEVAAAAEEAQRAEEQRTAVAAQLERLREQVLDLERRLAEVTLETRAGAVRRREAERRAAEARAELRRVQQALRGG